MNKIFTNSVYFHYQAPNADVLIANLDAEKQHEDQFRWGNTCQLERIKLDVEKYKYLMVPSMELFAKEVGINFDFNMDVPWLNIYKQRDFQEIHHHRPYDLVSVFFLEDHQEDFASFYFFDKHENEINYSIWVQSLGIKGNYFPEVKAGDIILFPAHMLHGVTPHKSDKPRRTFACNYGLSLI